MSVLFLALFAFPLLPLKASNAVFIAFSLLTLVSFFIRPCFVGRVFLFNLVFIIPFIPYLLEFLFSGLDSTARFEFEKKLFFFTAPLIIPLFIKITGFKNYKLPLAVFSLSVVALTLYTIVAMLIKGIPFIPGIYANGAYLLRHHFEMISGLHPTYYSVFALSSACFLRYAPDIEKRAVRQALVACSILLLLMVLFLAARIALATMMVIIFVFFLSKKMKLLKKLASVLLSLAIIVVFSFVTPSLNNRLGELFTAKTSLAESGNTVAQRVVISKCSLEVFKENIVFGTGSRYFQQKLDDCYGSEGWAANPDQSFNPHNQYLSIAINYGIFMFAIFIGSLVFICLKLRKIPEGKYFCITILLFFLSESILERQMGVYFFGLIALLLFNTGITLKLPPAKTIE